MASTRFDCHSRSTSTILWTFNCLSGSSSFPELSPLCLQILERAQSVESFSCVSVYAYRSSLFFICHSEFEFVKLRHFRQQRTHFQKRQHLWVLKFTRQPRVWICPCPLSVQDGFSLTNSGWYRDDQTQKVVIPWVIFQTCLSVYARILFLSGPCSHFKCGNLLSRAQQVHLFISLEALSILALFGL
jgi:hypothetical protein